MSLEKLADVIFPDIQRTPEEYKALYPKRTLKEGAKVTRYAPSPTGFQHIGGVFAALVSERIATQSGGVFYLRIEDTDQKREVEGAIADTIQTMHNFGMDFDEGMTGENSSVGNYGPYRQSEREEIYKTFAKDLVKKGLAYPCFCTPEELEAMREKQMAEKVTPGCYGEYAIYRNLSSEEALAKIEKGDKYILRLKSPGNPENRIYFTDLIKGETSFPENNQDIVIIKADGLPTYHFAHAIDDALMGTTTVIRGEEWLSSLPIHVQLFEVLGFERPEYAHIPNVMKLEGDSKRKLSKRKDPESAVTYYKEEGYPKASVVEYLLNIINSSFEEWRMENPKADYHDYPVALNKMSKSGALFDIIKLNDVSKDVICKMPAHEVYELYTQWAKEYDEEMYELVTSQADLAKAIFAIDKDGPKPRKDYAKWSDVKEKICYFFKPLFNKETIETLELPKNMTLEEAKRIIETYTKAYVYDTTAEEWFEELKTVAIGLGYTADRKAFKKDPTAFKGMVSDVAGVVRAALTHRTNTPDLYTIMHILGEEAVRERFTQFLSL
ncbi:glutamate--tRNA ligase [Sporanaerobium hydrogeniformans]|uniref:Glutamate--tRNA ligase n=1 Tax=Sporanaerobium hydrogeniformans TaxID=3072179 RepID=A0AC61DA68_9FIRM|nr:glutamate--tRNA ligase [Sporanaerobium hydrogeniformans]PHV69502.1 glutamate--tRNA ligase [Sporanaerobium hydrogeniformans]